VGCGIPDEEGRVKRSIVLTLPEGARSLCIELGGSVHPMVDIIECRIRCSTAAALPKASELLFMRTSRIGVWTMALRLLASLQTGRRLASESKERRGSFNRQIRPLLNSRHRESSQAGVSLAPALLRTQQ